ncbi:Dabb family protein [Clostridium cylindrosporum]|uniref:Stress responsive A/B barrel domain-containing protein n=1 Tax=Clostridium cylindrosporum DSM 605 TaxID=1121307 RepID=A0A0J8D4W6_CLOCY|nr:Dabb family protein [Clostridium cylindrosporum]KMT20862.1 stress responsive A/B barrel domain-containing protein [Clostridium cylindrosporum DSM 605]
MIRHTVMWKLKDSALDASKIENATKLKNMLENLKHDIKEIVSIEVGIDSTDNDDNYDVVLYSEFETLDDLNTYQNHPKHVEVGKFVAQIRESRVCVDHII